MHSSDLSDLSVEPSAMRNLSAEQKDRLTTILDRYLSGLENGTPVSVEQLKDAHPDLADVLETYLDQLNQLHDVAAGFTPGTTPEYEHVTNETLDDPLQKRLGDFVLQEEIGRGGMGVVYSAEQISLRRRVALKVLPFAAVLDSKQIARFQNEAQAAAQLHHPNIVPVYAVGVERGVHYFAMQYIDGQPLDRAISEMRLDHGSVADVPSTASWSRAQVEPGSQQLDFDPIDPPRGDDTVARNSTLTQNAGHRLNYYKSVMRLGVQAAEALQSAHEYGVVHRDIKPSNLLLEGNGKLWVTDFGLARCQTDKTITQTGDLVGTMRYMSPEQASGKSALVDQRTDVYSLAVTLYELLSLKPAFAGNEGPALLREIEQTEPTRLKRLCPGLPKDLETVINKGMAKARDERYQTAQEFAEDLQRVLDRRPTCAKPPSVVDHAAKWARRHHRLVISASALLVAAVVFLIIHDRKLQHERDVAKMHALVANENVRKAEASMAQLNEAAKRLKDIPAMDEIRLEILGRILGYHEGALKGVKGNPRLRTQLALAHTNIGGLNTDIGNLDIAIESHQAAIDIYEDLVKESPLDFHLRQKLGSSLNNLGHTLAQAGKSEESKKAYLRAIENHEHARSFKLGTSDQRQCIADLATSKNNLGLLLDSMGRANDAQAEYEDAVKLQQGLVNVDSSNVQHARNLAATLNNLSKLIEDKSPETAHEYQQQALNHLQMAAKKNPKDVTLQSDVALSLNHVAQEYVRHGKVDKAIEYYKQAIAIQQKLIEGAPSRNSYRSELALSYSNLAMAHIRNSSPQDAERIIRIGLLAQERLRQRNPNDVPLLCQLAGMYNNQGIILESLHHDRGAATAYEKAIQYQQQVRASAPKVAKYRNFLSTHLLNYGRVLRKLNRPDAAGWVALQRRSLWPHDAKQMFSIAEELGKACQMAQFWSPDARITVDQCQSETLLTLEKSVQMGKYLPAEIAGNDAFKSLKNLPAFHKLIEESEPH